jgi:hypothetical protein
MHRACGHHAFHREVGNASARRREELRKAWQDSPRVYVQVRALASAWNELVCAALPPLALAHVATLVHLQVSGRSAEVYFKLQMYSRDTDKTGKPQMSCWCV